MYFNVQSVVYAKEKGVSECATDTKSISFPFCLVTRIPMLFFFFLKEDPAHSGPCKDQTGNFSVISTTL